MEANKNLENLENYLPVFAFVVSFFLFNLFDLMQATRFVGASFFSLLSFMLMGSYLKKNKLVTKKQGTQLSFFSGLLTLLFAGICVAGYFHWARLFPFKWRWGILFGALIIFFAVMFHAIRYYILFKNSAQDK